MADLKMIILTDAESSRVADAAGTYLKSVAARRSDILFTSGAWTASENDTVGPSYPAAHPEVVGFAPVDVNFKNNEAQALPYTAFAAPGEYIMWTTPLDKEDFFKNSSAYGQGVSSISVSPPLAGVQANLWNAPPAGSCIGSGIGSVTAGLVDCGLGFEPCANATVSEK
jgi:hypothetical protein